LDEIKCNKLIKDISLGSNEALAELYTETKRAVFAYSLSIVRNKQIAEDVTHDVFIKIRLNSGKYHSNINSIGWILTITRNICFNVLKKQKHELIIEIDGNRTDLSQEDLDDNLILKSAMSKLSQLERQIMIMYLVVGISQKEISKLLKLPITLVNWKYREGIRKLSNILK
jgi:RNA polymerase sigma-70 factor (ECF subfamily)